MNNAALERLSSITERVQLVRPRPRWSRPREERGLSLEGDDGGGREQSRSRHAQSAEKALEHEKTPELAAKLAEEAVERDSWAAEVSQLAVPKLVEQVALNAWEQGAAASVCICVPASATSIPPARSKSWLKRWGVVRYAG